MIIWYHIIPTTCGQERHSSGYMRAHVWTTYEPLQKLTFFYGGPGFNKHISEGVSDTPINQTCINQSHRVKNNLITNTSPILHSRSYLVLTGQHRKTTPGARSVGTKQEKIHWNRTSSLRSQMFTVCVVCIELCLKHTLPVWLSHHATVS